MSSTSTVDKTKAHRSDDVPEPWLRQWDETYNNWFYINPTTEPPTVSWYHPASLDNDQLEAAAHAARGDPPAYGAATAASASSSSGTSNRVSQPPQQQQPQQPQRKQTITQDDTNNRFLGVPSGSDERRRSWGGSGLGAGLGGAAGGLLLGSLLSGGSSRRHRGYYSGGLYGHSMGPPPLGLGMGGFGGGFGRPYGGYGYGCGPFGGGGFGGSPFGYGGRMGGFGGGFGGGHHHHHHHHGGRHGGFF